MFFIKLTIQGPPIFHQFPTWHTLYFFAIFLEKNLEICIFSAKIVDFMKKNLLKK